MNSLKKFLRNHTEWLLATAGVAMAGAVIWFLVWGVGLLAQDMGNALASPNSIGKIEDFHLSEARNLDFKGLNGSQ